MEKRKINKGIFYSSLRARGLDGYDVALTRRRSPVRIRSSPLKKFL